MTELDVINNYWKASMMPTGVPCQGWKWKNRCTWTTSKH